MKILVTGASGFIGKHLIPRLIAAGHQVSTFSRGTLYTTWSSQVTHICGDICDLGTLRKATQNIEVVYHLAGLVSYQKSNLEKQYLINVTGTKNVMQSALENKVKRVIYTGSIAGIGIPVEGTVGNENTPYNLSDKELTYCDTKHQAGSIVDEYFRQGLDVVTLSPGIILGEDDPHSHHRTIFSSISRGWLLGCPPGGVMFSDIQDVVEILIKAINSGEPGQHYIIGNANLTYLEAATIFSKIFNFSPPRLILPGWLTTSVALVAETLASILGTTPVLTKQSAWLSQQKIFFSWAKAERELGYKPTPFESTVARVAPYYLSCK